ncbi:MAG: ATP-binding protein [Parcubacteria group bacterium]|jgi:hypothetical protein
MILYNKKIEDISYEDVVAFCNEKIRENVNLDYKEDFNADNKKLAMTLSAFANTFGGLVIVGVKDDDGVPLLPVEGLENKEGISEKVTRIIIDNIYPIIFPEVKVCKNDDCTKALVVIRIHPSNETPHAIRGNTRAYVRINDTKTPESLATMEQLEWLRNRRDKSDNLKKNLLTSATQRHNDKIYVPNEENTLIATFRSRKPFGSGYFSSIPIYPNQVLTNPDHLFDFLGELQINDYFSSGGFPRFIDKRRVINDGVVIKYNEKNYTEINDFGLLYYGEIFMQDIELLKQSFEREGEMNFDNIREDKLGYYGFYHLIARIDLLIEFAYKFYEDLGYWGYIELSFVLSETDNNFLYKGDENFTSEKIKKSLDYELDWNRNIMVQDLKEKRIELIKDFCQQLGWCYGERLAKRLENEMIEKYLKKNNRIDLK